MIVQFDVFIIPYANLLSKLYASFAALICQLQLTLKTLLSRSSMFIDGNGGTYEVDLEDIESSKADPLGKTIITSKFRR